MSKSKGELVSVRIIVPNEQGNPPGKLADAEVIFEADAGPLSGMKLLGFAVWERRDGGRNVTFPARQVLRERGTPDLRAVAARQRGAQCAGRDQAVHPRRVHPRRGPHLVDPDDTQAVGLSPAAWGPRRSRGEMADSVTLTERPPPAAWSAFRKGRRNGDRDAQC